MVFTLSFFTSMVSPKSMLISTMPTVSGWMEKWVLRFSIVMGFFSPLYTCKVALNCSMETGVLCCATTQKGLSIPATKC